MQTLVDPNATRIWKFDITPNTRGVEMPRGSKILHVAVQNGKLRAWAMVNPDAPLVCRKLYAMPTGADVKQQWKYVGTAHEVTPIMTFVWHVFDAGEEATTTALLNVAKEPVTA